MSHIPQQLMLASMSIIIKIQVSPRIAAETANGVRYSQRAGQQIHLPSDQAHWPDRQLLAWHQHEVFLAG